MTRQPPDSGPFGSREQAEAVFAAFRQAAALGRSGPDVPRGEQLVFTAHQWAADALTDTIELRAEAGEYDRVVIARLARLLDPVDIGVVCSWIYRAAGDGDVPDNPTDRKDTDH